MSPTKRALVREQNRRESTPPLFPSYGAVRGLAGLGLARNDSATASALRREEAAGAGDPGSRISGQACPSGRVSGRFLLNGPCRGRAGAERGVLALHEREEIVWDGALHRDHRNSLPIWKMPTASSHASRIEPPTDAAVILAPKRRFCSATVTMHGV